MNTLLSALLGNAAVAVPLSLLAWVTWRFTRHAALTRFVCLLIVIKLLTPPLWSLPVHLPAAASRPAALVVPVAPVATLKPMPPTRTAWPLIAAGIVLVWSVGTGSYVFVVARNLRRARRLVRRAAPADARTVELAAEAASRLGMRRLPEVRTTAADVSPFVLAYPRRPAVILPARLAGELPDSQLRAVLAHELAHLRRLDHVWRWLETAATALYWWHPCLWWTRSVLRTTEELCCDGHVAEAFREDSRDYSLALLAAASAFPPPSPAVHGAMCLVADPRSLERRIRMIQSRSGFRMPRSVRALALGVAAALLPVSVALADPPPLPSMQELIDLLTSSDTNVIVKAFDVGAGGQLTPMPITNLEIADMIAEAAQHGGASMSSLSAAYTLGPNGELVKISGDDLPAGINLQNLGIEALVQDAMGHLTTQNISANCAAYMVGPNGQVTPVNMTTMDPSLTEWLNEQLSHIDLNALVQQALNGH